MPKVYEFVAHVRNDHSGPFGDGSKTFRFRKETDAKEAAKGKVYYGKPVEVTCSDVSAKLFARWKREGQI